jgi:hypothetical protein
MVRQIIFAGLLVVLPAGLQAQGRGAMPPVFHSAAVAPRAVMSGPHSGTETVVSGPRAVVRSGMPHPRTGLAVPRSTRPVNSRSRIAGNGFGMRSGCGTAPGFGFDAVHQAAVCGSTGVGSRFRGQIPLFFPFFDGGFFLPGATAPEEESSATDTAQPEITDSENRDRGRRYRVVEPQAAPAVEPASAAPADNDEFVFVRRDGTVFFAVAYSWEKGTLRYITNQGLRHTVTQDALDLDATRQFNEQRGLNFRLPA